jgi:hypothetical protein
VVTGSGAHRRAGLQAGRGGGPAVVKRSEHKATVGGPQDRGAPPQADRAPPPRRSSSPRARPRPNRTTATCSALRGAPVGRCRTCRPWTSPVSTCGRA